MGTFKPYHIIHKKSGNIVKYWVYGKSPKEVKKKLMDKFTYDRREYQIVPVSVLNREFKTGKFKQGRRYRY